MIILGSEKSIVRQPIVQDHRQRVNAAMRFMLENTAFPLNIEAIADAASFSPFHFHRLFGHYVGETPAEYFRKAKMKKAASLLLMDWKVSDILEETGYVTISSFGKAFRQVFGLSPSAFKGLHGQDPVKFPVAARKAERPKILAFNPRIVLMPSFQIFYTSHEIMLNGIVTEKIGRVHRQAYQEWENVLNTTSANKYPHKKLGVLKDFTSIMPGKCTFDACITFPKPLPHQIFEGFKVVKCTEIYAGKWAEFIHQGPYDTLWQTWNWAYNHWLPQSSYTKRPVEAFEAYFNDHLATPPQNLITGIYIPIY